MWSGQSIQVWIWIDVPFDEKRATKACNFFERYLTHVRGKDYADQRIELAGDGFTMVPIRQGFQSLSGASKELERRVLTRAIRHGRHPILRWMMDCCTIKQDPAGNIQPVKPDRSKSSKRIDGIVTIVMGLDRVMRHQETEPDVRIAFI